MIGQRVSLPGLLCAGLCAVVLCLWASPVAAQSRAYVGPGKCTDCHDHKDEKEWSEKRDGDGRGKQHINALNQLSDPKAEGWAKAIGLADAYDVKGTCVRCHATTVRGSPDFGISCESCHGPGRDYLQPHQEKGAYEKVLALGMKDVWKKPERWVPDCMNCHVLGDNASDPKLAAAGHPTGANFAVGTKFTPVAGHWTSKYTANQINAIGAPLRASLLKRVAGAATAEAAPPAATPAPATPAPATPAPPTPAAAPATPAPAAPAPSTPSAPSTPAPSTPRAPRAAAPSPGLPSAPAPVVTTPPAAGGDAALVVQLPPEPTLPPTPAGIVASVQGRLAALLDALLSRGTTTPTPVTPPAKKTVYRGADADLLRLQEEVIALALDALGTAPAPKPPPQQ